MTKPVTAPEPHEQPRTDPNSARRTLGAVEPEQSEPQDEDLGIEIDNAIERPRDGHPGERGKTN